MKKILVVFYIFTFITLADENKLHIPREDVTVQELDVIESYSEAQKLEKEIAKMYSEIRATQLSLIQRQTLKQSLTDTKVPVSQRQKVNEETIRSKAKSAEEITEYQKELKTVMRETDAIVTNSRDMLESLLPKPKEQELETEIPQEMQQEMPEQQQEQLTESEIEKAQQENVQEEQTHEEMLAELEKKIEDKVDTVEEQLKEVLKEMEKAKEDIKEKKAELKEEKEKEEFQELEKKMEKAEVAVNQAIKAIQEEQEYTSKKVEKAREALKELAEALKETKEVEKELEEKEEKPVEEKVEEIVLELEETKEELNEAVEMMEYMQELELSENVEIARIQTLGMLAHARMGKALDITEQMRGRNLHIKPRPVTREEMPPSIDDNFKNTAGRKIMTSTGKPAVWFYLSDWYLIGPYDNTERKNLTTVFPPQSIVDLDATYSGRNGRILQWQYDSFSGPMVWPGFSDSYSIYYGYTEVFCETEIEVWIAVGSDDRSDLWINDLPVWHSSNKLKGWYLKEGYRKVYLKKGRNKFLFRLENGWKEMGMSVLICTPNSDKK